MSLFSKDDVGRFRSERILLVAAQLNPDLDPTDDYLLAKILAAEAETSRQLRVKFEPTHVFPHPPSDDEIAALPSGMPWVEEPGNDYDPEFFRGDRWGFIVLRQPPVISVASIKFVYPQLTQSFYQVPDNWIRLDKRAGHIRLVPASGSFTAPLNAFIMQAMGGGSIIPGMIQVEYVTGLADARADYPDLIDVIFKKAALKVIEDLYLPTSASVSGDGLSQSLSFDASKHRELIQETLFGPKGSNGGLWVSIHGIASGILGVT